MIFKTFQLAQRPLLWGLLLGFSVGLSCHSVKKQVGDEALWHTALPTCPCENPDRNGVRLDDGWAKDEGNIEKYHKGANECFRSYPAMETAEGMSGQQCCYDAEGRLITEGSAAGTPDKVSTCNGEDRNGKMTIRAGGLLGHYAKDVKPWEAAGGQDSGWVKYNLLWVPNKGKNCLQNKKP